MRKLRPANKQSSMTARIDPHQQLYSEVIALRKELEMVKEDEARLRDQLGNSKLHKAALKEEVTEELDLLEEDANDSSLKSVWARHTAEQSPDKMDWSTIDISNLHKRTKAARKVFLKAKKKADTMLGKQDKAINKNADSSDEKKEKLRDAFDEEMENLQEARERLRQIEKEESYHNKRGTNRGRPHPIAPEKVDIAKEQRRQALENRTIERVSKLRAEHHDLTEDLRKIENQVSETKRIGDANKRCLETELKSAEEDGQEAGEVHRKLLEEQQRIKKLHEDMNRVLAYLHAAHKIN